MSRPPLYKADDLVCSVIATLLGCKAGSGLVNELNALRAQGAFKEDDTYGWILRCYLDRQIIKLGEVSRTSPDPE